jgi:hypothetical protein
VLVVVLAAGTAHADSCEDDVALQAAVDDEVKGLNIWSWSWGSIYAAAAVTQTAVAVALKANDPARVDLVIGAVSAFVGSASLFLLPLRFTRPLAHSRTCETLEKVASEQAVGKSWLGHLGTVVVNAAILLIEGLGYGHWQAGFIGAGIGLAVGELNLWTQPTHLRSILDHREPPAVRVVPLWGAMNGAALSISF